MAIFFICALKHSIWSFSTDCHSLSWRSPHHFQHWFFFHFLFLYLFVFSPFPIFQTCFQWTSQSHFLSVQFLNSRLLLLQQQQQCLVLSTTCVIILFRVFRAWNFVLMLFYTSLFVRLLMIHCNDKYALDLIKMSIGY